MYPILNFAILSNDPLRDVLSSLKCRILFLPILCFPFFAIDCVRRRCFSLLFFSFFLLYIADIRKQEEEKVKLRRVKTSYLHLLLRVKLDLSESMHVIIV